MEYLLEDITVIDAATFLAGPGGSTILADFGANVIKIEPPGGDGYRGLVGAYPVPYHWQLTSRNKKSLVLDLTKDAGQALMHKMIAKADVLTTNYLDGQLKRYKLEYERVKKINPRLIFAHISGYGLEGPEATRRAFDVTGWWARSGMMEFVRDQGQMPLIPAPGMGDHATATAFFGAIMTGLYRRERTGEGSFVSTSLAANGVWANGMALQGVIAGNDLGVHRQEKGWINPLSGCYQTSDGHYVVLTIINTAREYPQLCASLGHEEWLEDERFAAVRTMYRNRVDFQDLLRDAFAEFSLDEACRRLDEHGITYGLVQPMAAVLEDEQLRANGIVVETNDEGDDYSLTIGSPVNVLEAAKKPPRRAPDIGADTLDVLREMNFDEDYIRELVSAKVVINDQGETT
jgi:formyl-CoA transferase